jgi:CHAD domain-containing protein
MSVEREVKLGASPAFAVPDLAGVVEGLRVVRRPNATLHTIYYDAPDLRLLRWGTSLRYREGQGWTVKLPPSERADVLHREEIEFPGDGGVVPPDALDLLAAYRRSADVQPVLRLRTERRTWELRDPAGRVLAEVLDDSVEIVSGTPIHARFRELEVEQQAEGAEALVAAVVARLRVAGAGAPDPTPKPIRALGPIASAPADVVVGELPPNPTAGEVVRRAIASSVVHLVRHDPVVRLDTDPEGVHQARVATRRLRSDLRTFGPLVDPEATRAIRAELGWLAEALGEARDADVLLDRIRARVATLGPSEAPAATHVVGALEHRDKEAHAALIEAVRSPRYTALLEVLVDAANAPPLRPEASALAADVLPGLVRDPWRKLRKAVDRAGADAADAVLHGIRIRAKRTRYAAEAVAPVVGETARRFAKAAARLQDELGEHQDAVVAQAWLRGWAAEQASVDEAFAAGMLAGLEDAAARASRSIWRRAWKGLDRRSLRSWM